MRGKRVVFFVSLFLSFPLLASAKGFKSHVHPSLITSVKSFKPGEPFKVGVRFTINPGWHIYWINPGDAGLETKVKWDTIPGIQINSLKLPAPKKFILPASISYGYEKETVFVSEVVSSESFASPQIKLNAHVSWLACKELCIPGKSTVSMILNSSKEEIIDAKGEGMIRKYEAKIPGDSKGFHISAGYSGELIKIIVKSNSEITVFKPLYFFPVRSDLLVHEPELKSRKTQEGFELLFKRSKIFKGKVEWIEGVLTLERNHRNEAIEILIKADETPIQKF